MLKFKNKNILIESSIENIVKNPPSEIPDGGVIFLKIIRSTQPVLYDIYTI